MSDRLEQIRLSLDNKLSSFHDDMHVAEDVEWLLDEVDRLRAERDAALTATKVGPDEFVVLHMDPVPERGWFEDVPEVMQGRLAVTDGSVSVHRLRRALDGEDL